MAATVEAKPATQAPAAPEDDFGAAVLGFLGWGSAPAGADAADANGKGSAGGASASANVHVSFTGAGAGSNGKSSASLGDGKTVAPASGAPESSFMSIFANLGSMFPPASPPTTSGAPPAAASGYGAGWQSGDGGVAKSATASASAAATDAPGRGRRPRSTYAPIDAAGDEQSRAAKRESRARSRGPAAAYWRAASDAHAGATPPWWDWRSLSETEQSQWIATALLIVLSAVVGAYLLNGGGARLVSVGFSPLLPLLRGVRIALDAVWALLSGAVLLLVDAVVVAWSLLLAPFSSFSRSNRNRGVAYPRASVFSFLERPVYDVPAMPYGARPGPRGAADAAAAAYGGYGAAAGVARAGAFAPLLPPPGSLYAYPSPSGGFRPGARPPMQLPGARGPQVFAPGARSPLRAPRTAEQVEQDRRAALFHAGRCGSANADVELCDSIKQRRWSAPRDRAGRVINADVPVQPLGGQYNAALAAQTAHDGFYAAPSAGGSSSSNNNNGDNKRDVLPFAHAGGGRQCGPQPAPPPPPPPPPRQCGAPKPPPPQCSAKAEEEPQCLAEAQAAALSEAEALAAESAAAAAAELAQAGDDGECAAWLAADDQAKEESAAVAASVAATAAPAPAAAKAGAAAPAKGTPAAVGAAKATAAPAAAAALVARSAGGMSALQRERAVAYTAAKCGTDEADAAACKALLDSAPELLVAPTSQAATAAAAAAAAPAAPRASLWARLLAGAKSKPAPAAEQEVPAAASAQPAVAEPAAAAEEAVATEAAAAPSAQPAGLSPVARSRVAVAQAAAACAAARGASDAAAAALRSSQAHLSGRVGAAAEAHAACRDLLPAGGRKPSRALAARHAACVRQSDELALAAEAASDELEAAARESERLATAMVERCEAVAAAAAA